MSLLSSSVDLDSRLVNSYYQIPIGPSNEEKEEENDWININVAKKIANLPKRIPNLPKTIAKNIPNLSETIDKTVENLSEIKNKLIRKRQFSYVESTVISTTVIAIAAFVFSNISKRTNYQPYAFGAIIVLGAYCYKHLQKLKENL